MARAYSGKHGNFDLGSLKLLPKHQREVCALRTKGARYQEIASALDIPIGTVRSRINRARAKLEALTAQSEAA